MVSFILLWFSKEAADLQGRVYGLAIVCRVIHLRRDLSASSGSNSLLFFKFQKYTLSLFFGNPKIPCGHYTRTPENLL